MSQPERYCTFVVDGLCFGVDVMKVQEVLLYEQMTRVPLAPAVVGGLLNLRGQIVTAIDLRRRLGLRERPESALPMNVVVRSDDSTISLLVDEIGDVLDVAAESFERTPRALSPSCRDLIKGVYKLKDRLLLILDIEKALAVEPVANGQKKADLH